MVTAVKTSRTFDHCTNVTTSTKETQSSVTIPDAKGRETIGWQICVLMEHEAKGLEELIVVTVEEHSLAEILRAMDIKRKERKLWGYVTKETFELKCYPYQG
jgi:hypothetical protein